MLKIGDKVKMTPRGFRFYSNVDIVFDMNSIARVMSQEHFTSAVCEQFAIHGVGTVKSLNDGGDPYVRWDFSINGVRYHYTHYFCKKDLKKLNFIDRLKAKLKRLL